MTVVKHHHNTTIKNISNKFTTSLPMFPLRLWRQILIKLLFIKRSYRSFTDMMDTEVRITLPVFYFPQVSIPLTCLGVSLLGTVRRIQLKSNNGIKAVRLKLLIRFAS